jgi:asparagine synthase (glutamine-hydrolysing)
MCGIAGICNINGNRDISLPTLKRMTHILSHRGPDETGIYLDDRIGLGHARLSIIDLSSGTQPIHNEDKTMWITYNGEVYNYIELRDELKQKGHKFYTTSDTEVILHLYEEKGIACLDDLNGQFAFAIWDTKNKELFLARDRVGIRPLHYTIQNEKLIFSSEIKSIFMCDQVSREIDPIALDQIFTFWTTLPGHTAFKDIHELPPGHYLKISSGKVQIKKYWQVPFYPRCEQLDWSPDEISEKIQELLLDAVRLRMRADVPVGTYLSGGLDSSGLTAMVVKNFNSDVRTFGIRFEEEQFDEGTYQNQMVSFLNTNHSEITATNEKICDSLSRVIWHCEKPLLRTAPVPLYLLSKLVRENGLKVVLSGEGADEVFGGYNIFKEAKVRSFWSRQKRSQSRADLIGQLYPYIFKNPRLKKTLQLFFAKGLDQVDDPLFSHMIRWGNTSKTKTFFSEDTKTAIGSYDGYREIRESLPPEYDQWDHLSRAQYLETGIFLSNYLLSSQGDRMAMANSVEIRMPYLDPNVMEFMARVPSKWKILGLDEKHILKKAFQDILPKDITDRPKHPYRAPIKQSLFSKNTAGFTNELLDDKAIENAGIFDTQRVKRLQKKVLNSPDPSETENMALIGIISSQLIFKQFIDNFSEQTKTATTESADPVVYDQRQSACKDSGYLC